MMGDLNLKLTAGLDAPSRARHAVRAQLGARIPVARLSALLTVVSELVTNSVKYGPGRPIHLAIALSKDGAVLGRVEDGGRGRVAVRENVDPAEGGMGLRLVDAFTDRWGVEDGTTTVWFEVAPRRFAPR
jgi:anti-sigma regulatory factor (Ser/Thr protein kinase)